MHRYSKRKTTIPLAVPIKVSGEYSGNDGNWSTFQINVGSPAQSFNALVSLSSVSTWLAIPLGCDKSPGDTSFPANCAQLRGASSGLGWNSSLSTTKSDQEDLNLTVSPFLDIEWFRPSPDYNYTSDTSDLSTGSEFLTDQIAFSTDTSPSVSITATNAPIFGVTDLTFWVDTIGVGFGSIQVPNSVNVSSLLQSMAAASQIPSISVGYTAGAYYSEFTLLLNNLDSYILFTIFVEVCRGLANRKDR
jgi:hypothetical protein